MLQLDFFLAPAPVGTPARPARSAPQRKAAGISHPSQLPVAEALYRGMKVEFPKDANALRVTIGGKTLVILKADADTLQGAGVASVVEFGTVKNDAKGHPLRKNFEALATAPPAKTAQAGHRREGPWVLSLQ